MKIKEGFLGCNIALILEKEECLIIFAPSGESVILFVDPQGKLVFFCETDVIESISGNGMAEKIRKGLYGISHDRFLNYCYDWEVLVNGKMFFEVTILVPSSDMRTCAYLSLEKSGKFSIVGGASIIESIIGPNLDKKIVV